jgi:hypothetical protein
MATEIWPQHQRAGDLPPQSSTSGAPAVPRARPVVQRRPRKTRAVFKCGVLIDLAGALIFAQTHSIHSQLRGRKPKPACGPPGPSQ